MAKTWKVRCWSETEHHGSVDPVRMRYCNHPDPKNCQTKVSMGCDLLEGPPLERVRKSYWKFLRNVYLRYRVTIDRIEEQDRLAGGKILDGLR